MILAKKLSFLFKEVGIINNKITIIIAIIMIIKIFLLSLINSLPLDRKKRKKMKVNDMPSAKQDEREKVTMGIIPIIRIPIKSSIFLIPLLIKNSGIARDKGRIKYPAK